MQKEVVMIEGVPVSVYSLNTAIVGSGCAGFNAADSLYSLGQKDIAIITEGLKMGTSRNTGSDKQTYYKLTMAGDEKDSVVEMAKTLFDGGCMHGDIALTEAALSSRNFFKLIELGVPFPHNNFGEYIGYKTDHDPRQRATSAGPLTSKYMTQCLEKRVIERGIDIFDGYLVIGILTDKGGGYNQDSDNGGKHNLENPHKAIGLMAINLNKLDETDFLRCITLFNCKNIIYATGGPAGMYCASVYPESQIGGSGIAFEIGAKGVNLTESQYGIASIKFRWNLSGTYQQVLPRYVSTDINGDDEKEFLDEYFPETGKMLDAIFLKGYQWPFDPKKIADFGSSLIDILVYNEIQIKGRRVFLDYTKNPTRLDFSKLGQEAYNYLQNSSALFGTPIGRLEKMNMPAVKLYKNNGIDLVKEYLEISVCAQHNNGGLSGNMWWESNIKNFFPVGEVNGTFGVYRPGGSALNSTQTGSLRAAQYISINYMQAPPKLEVFIETAKEQIDRKIGIAKKIISNTRQFEKSSQCKQTTKGKQLNSNVFEVRKRMQERMTACGAHIRSYDSVKNALAESLQELSQIEDISRITCLKEIPEVFRNIDIAITQYIYLYSIKEYIEKGGKSRGSYLIHDEVGLLPQENLPQIFSFSLEEDENFKKVVNEIQVTQFNPQDNKININSEWIPRRPIPQGQYWFENVWREYREIYNKY